MFRAWSVEGEMYVSPLDFPPHTPCKLCISEALCVSGDDSLFDYGSFIELA